MKIKKQLWDSIHSIHHKETRIYESGKIECTIEIKTTDTEFVKNLVKYLKPIEAKRKPIQAQ